MKVLNKVVNRKVMGHCNLCKTFIELSYQEYVETIYYGSNIRCPTCNRRLKVGNPIEVCEYDDGTIEEYVHAQDMDAMSAPRDKMLDGTLYLYGEKNGIPVFDFIMKEGLI